MAENRFPGVVEVPPSAGGLGGRLAQYCVGRIVAGELGFSLQCGEIPGFPGASPLGAGDPRPPAGTGVGLESSRVPALRAGPAGEPGTVTLTGHRLDLPALRAERDLRRIVVTGPFGRHDIFRPHKAAISGWLAPAQPLPAAAADDLTIHVRSGDVWQASAQGAVRPDRPALPFSFYADIVRSRSWSKVLVVTDDAADPLVGKLCARFGAEVRSGSALDDFRALQASANLVLSVSRFAWWAGWLSSAARIYYPVTGLFDRERARDRPALWQHDLWVGDEPRYTAIVPPGLTGDWQGNAHDRQRLLGGEASDSPTGRTPGHGPPAVERGTLALVEGFHRPRDGQAQGADQAAYQLGLALAEQDRYNALHLYRDGQRRPASPGELALPPHPPTAVFDRLLLHGTRERYAAIYVAEGEPLLSAPHLLRPRQDWAPVICTLATAHAGALWSNLLVALASGAVRATDGIIFKSRACESLFRRTLADWSARLGLPAAVLGESTVIPGGVDLAANQRSDNLRDETRRRLRLDSRDLVFLWFSRLSPGTKGDLQALLVRWKEVVERLPQALLLLAGTVVERSFVADLRLLARAAGVAHRVVVVDNPPDLLPGARNRLMSAADVFLHLGTGVDETSPLVVLEAMAHGLPVIATAWAGLPELVSAGETGLLIDTRSAPVAPYIAATLFGQADRAHLLYASKVVACDWTAFVGAAQALAYDERRKRMGAAAKKRAQAHALPTIARRYVQFFDDTARAAERAWNGPTPARPLVDLDALVASQATRPLALDDRVRLSDPARARLVTLGLHPEPPARLEQLLARFHGRDHLTIAELAAASARPTANGSAEAGTQEDLAIASRFLVRLLNIGVLELLT
jgi:glycosyltransferase involved in cell wall biosynthesis